MRATILSRLPLARPLPTPSLRFLSSRSKDEKEKQREQEMMEKVQKPLDEEDHQESVSFEGKHMYAKALLFSGAVIGTGFLFNWYATKKVQKRKMLMDEYVEDRGQDDLYAMQIKDDQIGGPWQLVDWNGKPFGSKNLEGSYYLLYFGYSHCPDISLFSTMKMSKAARIISRSRESRQFFNFKPVFVTVRPEEDTPEELRKFSKLFSAPIIFLREESSLSPNLQSMLRLFKVPAGLNDKEKQAIKGYFIDQEKRLYNRQSGFDPRKKKFGERISLWWSKRQEKYDAAEGTFSSMDDHSRVFYLMAPDNKCIGFFDLELSEQDLAERIMEDISFDMGVKLLAQKNQFEQQQQEDILAQKQAQLKK